LHNHTSPVKGFEHFGHLPVEVLADEISGVNYNKVVIVSAWMDGKLIIEAWW